MRRLLTAAVVLGLLAGSLLNANASTPRSLSLSGASGAAFVVTVDSNWRLDFGHLKVSGGARYEGVTLELLGRPANDGLAIIALRLPDSPKAKAGSLVHALGAVDAHGVSVSMPAGRYLMVLVGDNPVHLAIPLSGEARIRAVSPVKAHGVRFVQTSTAAALSPGVTGLYAGQLSLRLPLGQDPLVMTHLATTFEAGAQMFDLTECARRDTTPCPSEKDPTFGTGNQSSGSDAVQTEDYYDGFDGLSSQHLWFDRAVVRGSHPGATLYAAAVVVDGGNT